MNTNENTTPQFPANWRIAADYDPQDHMMNLKGKDYLNVQNRLLWFVKDQRDFIARGLATTSYVIRTELVEQDRDAGYAHFKTYVRDVLGNEATMYGSETARDFGDYAEKASTKSLGRALAMLGYGTQYAAEMDEGERVVDTPVERRRPEPPKPGNGNAPVRAPQPRDAAPATPPDSMDTTTASAKEQTDLAEKLRKAGYGRNAANAFLASVTKRAPERELDVTAIAEGTSDLSLRELATISQRLTALSNGKAAHHG